MHRSISSDLRNCMQIVDAGAIWPLVRLLRECRDITIPTRKSQEYIESSRSDSSSDGEDIVHDAESESLRADIAREQSSCQEAVACLLQNIGLYELRQVSEP